MLWQTTSRLSGRPPALFLLLLSAMLVCWGIHARVSSYHVTSSSQSSQMALYEKDDQKSKASCEEQSRLQQQVVNFCDLTSSLIPVVAGKFTALRDQQVSGPVRPALPFYPTPAFFRPPPQPSV